MRTSAAVMVVLSSVAYAGVVGAQTQDPVIGSATTAVGGAGTPSAASGAPAGEVNVMVAGNGPGATIGSPQGSGPGSALPQTDNSRPDHEIVSQRLGLRIFPATSVASLGAGTGMGGGFMPVANSFTVPTVGLRYYLNPRIGVEVGLGLNYASGSQSTAAGGTVMSSGQPSEFAFGIVAGLPIVLGYFRHINFAVIPYLSLYQGFGWHTVNPAAPTSYNLSSTQFSLGGQVMAELSLGAIGFPQISIEARFGLRLVVTSDTLDTATAGIPTSANVTNVGFGTTIGNWSLGDLIASSFAINYYF